MPIVLIVVAVLAVGGLVLYRETKAAIATPVPPPVVIAAPPMPTMTQQAENALAPTAVAATNAIPVVGPALASVENILLGQHSARLKGATQENQAIPPAVAAFDQDFAQLIGAYNSGEANAQQCIDALIQMDLSIYSSMHNLGATGKPGTSWSAPSTQTIGIGINPAYPAPCDKTCTAACCVYYNDLRPAIFGRNVSAGGPTAYAPFQTRPGIVGGAIEALRNGNGIVKVITVAPPSDPAYGNFSRAGYTVAFSQPSTVPTSLAHLT